MTEKKVVFKGKLLKIYTAKRKLSNGYTVYLEIVEHPGAALVIPFLTKDKIILLKQFRPVINSHIYELPAGTIQKGESLINCVKREIIEEIGYSAKKITKLGAIFPVPGYSTERITIFKAEQLIQRERDCQEDEIIKTIIIDRRRVRKFFKSGKIVDAKTICAFSMCGWL